MADYTSYNYYAIGDDNNDGMYFHGSFILPQDNIGTQLFVAGTLAAPITTAVASNKLVQIYATSTDTGDNNRLAYLYYNASGVGGGFETIRGKCIGTVAGLNAIRAGSFSAGVDTTATSQVTGLGAGVEAMFEAGAATRVMTGTITCLNAVSYIGAGNTVPVSHSFIRCSDSGSVGFTNLLDLSAFTESSTSATVLCSTSTDDTSTHRIKIRGPGGVVMWLMATSTTPH
ncbi:MAG: hypothetical protein ACYDHZ_00415 [Dehalococcoidia bacterium]